MIDRLISRLTMKYQYSLFTDVVNGKPVNLYIDDYGVEWMAQSKWGFRTKRNED
jgi:hypothetical protein